MLYIHLNILQNFLYDGVNYLYIQYKVITVHFLFKVLLFENHTMFCYNWSSLVARFSFQNHAMNSSDFFQTYAKIMIDFIHISSEFIARFHPHLSFVVAYLIRCPLLLNNTNPNEQ